MNQESKYVKPPSDGIFKRFITMVFKTPYRRLSMSEKIIKLTIQLAIAAAAIYASYIVLKVVFTIIITIIVVVLILSSLSSGDKEIHVVDKWGKTKERYKKY